MAAYEIAIKAQLSKADIRNSGMLSDEEGIECSDQLIRLM